MRIETLDPAGYRRTPWKNGGGVTVDIAAEYAPGAEPGGWTGMVWRFGRTRIERPGPFSDLTGYDRILTVIGGRGLVLRPEGHDPLDVREPFRPVRFPGEWAIESALEDEPVEVLNLMADRNAVEVGVAFLTGASDLPLAPGTWLLYAVAETAVLIDERPLTLPRDGAAVLTCDAPLRITVAGAPLALASILRRDAVAGR
jgi:environmental stress-induced protein Ves